MKNVLVYFSSTGNCLTVARELAKELGDTQLVAIGRDAQNNLDLSTAERIGIVFPVYYWSLPLIVNRFVAGLKLSDSQYVFGVATFAGACGTSFAQLSEAVAQGSGTLRAAYSMHMPGNYIVKYGAFPVALQRMILGGVKKKVARIAALVRSKTYIRIPAGDWVARKTEQMNAQSMAGFGGMASNFHVTEACTSCGTCAKLCPVGNIKLTKGRPQWGTACEQCVACIQWCPVQAIQYADRTQKRKRYHHPQVTVRDFLTD